MKATAETTVTVMNASALKVIMEAIVNMKLTNVLITLVKMEQLAKISLAPINAFVPRVIRVKTATITSMIATLTRVRTMVYVTIW